MGRASKTPVLNGGKERPSSVMRAQAAVHIGELAPGTVGEGLAFGSVGVFGPGDQALRPGVEARGIMAAVIIVQAQYW